MPGGVELRPGGLLVRAELEPQRAYPFKHDCEVMKVLHDYGDSRIIEDPRVVALFTPRPDNRLLESGLTVEVGFACAGKRLTSYSSCTFCTVRSRPFVGLLGLMS